MKKLLIILGFLFVFTSNTQIFSQDEMVTVKKSDLPADLVQKLDQQKKLNEIKENLDTIRSITSIGKEIGIAINDGLAAVTNQTVKFAETTPGKFTMMLIAWKVVAKDIPETVNAIMGIIFGIPFLIFFDLLMLWSFRRTTNQKTVLESEENNIKKYQQVDTWYTKESTDDNENGNKMAYLICWWIIFAGGNIWIVAGVIF